MLATKSCLSPIALLRRVLYEQQQQPLTPPPPPPTLHSNDQGILTKSPYTTNSDIPDNVQRRSIKNLSNSNADAETITGDENNNNNNDITSNITITPTMFMNLCPALLVQIEQGACAEVVRVEMGKLEKGFGLGKYKFSLEYICCFKKKKGFLLF